MDKSEKEFNENENELNEDELNEDEVDDLSSIKNRQNLKVKNYFFMLSKIFSTRN